ncbi:hypothetical protein ACNKXS_10325 [Christiangramia marina]|uniref:hypothetical protein n=1 Tax=Christiangramia marina TaxID=409436 RepID=UPI003AA98901
MKKIIVIFLLLTGISANSQSTENQFSINFLMPSAEYELALGENTSLDAILGLGFGYHYSDFTDESEFGVYPNLRAQYRWYYNFDKRIDKGKKVSENSGNYVAGILLLSSGEPIIGDMELRNDLSGFVGPAWGLQRVYGSNFKLNLNLGIGYGFNDNGDGYVSPLIDIQLGFKLGKDKS